MDGSIIPVGEGGGGGGWWNAGILKINCRGPMVPKMFSADAFTGIFSTTCSTDFFIFYFFLILGLCYGGMRILG